MAGRLHTGKVVPYVLAAGILVALYVLGLIHESWYSDIARRHYLLFHSLVELFAISVAVSVFLVFWNARRFVTNSYLLLVAISFLSVAVLDTMHMLAYRGMGVFASGGTNLATQLWIAGRYVQGLSFLVAPLVVGRRLRTHLILGVYAAVTVGLLVVIFAFGTFPTCFVEIDGGSGRLTDFKVTSEYAICAVLAAAALLLYRKRIWFDRRMFVLLMASIGSTILSELAFTLYTDPYGLPNTAGHLLKLVAFYLIYRALVKVSLTEPHNLLLRSLKDSEEALRQSEKRHRELVENLNEGILVIDKDGRVTYANPRMGDLLGYSVKEMAGRHLFEFLDDGAVGAARRHLERREQGIGEQCDLEFVRKDGTRITTTLETAPILGPDGQYAGASAAVMDITGRKRAEKERERLLRQLENEQARLKAIIDSAPEGIVVVDDQGDVVMTNPAAERLYRGALPFGYQKEDASACRICYPDGRPYEMRDLPMVRAARDGQTHTNLEMAIVWPDGERRDMLENTAPIRDSQGRLRGAVGIFQDISEEHKFRAELLRRTEQLETLIREAHHRIRNNLQSVISLLELEREHMDASSTPSLDRCVSRVRAIAMVHRLLTSEATSAVPLQSLLKGLAELAKATYVDPNTKAIEIGVTGRNLAVSSKDATSLAIVVNELMANAILHAFSGRSHGRVNVAVAGGGDRPVVITVSDDGCGLPESIPEGTGLRLARTIVEHDLGGTFRMEALAQGTRSTLSFTI